MCKCPKCDAELEINGMVCADWCGDAYVVQGYGYCPKCKTEYSIDMVYNFSQYEINEINDD